MRQARYWIILLPLFLVLTCVGAFAQANSDVTGTVTDQMGAVVGGANITLTDQATGAVRTTVSSGAGLYDIPGLNPSTYNMKVTAKGFQTFVKTGIVVNVSMTFSVNVKLTVGAESTTINVMADALTVQADSNVVSTLITSQDIESIATENRNFAALAALGLGVSSELPDSNPPAAFSASFSLSINGLRQSHNIWLIDGGESSDRGGAGGMQIQPSQDAIAEFQMLTSNYTPDYGISSGATISLSLKSGTKTFHGSAWEENRNTDYDANSYFNNKAGNPRVPTKWNIYGFNVGGPLYIPNTYNTSKKKTFFFYNEEWRRTTAGAASNNNTIDPLDVPLAANIKTIGAVTGLPYVDPVGVAHATDAGHTWLQVPSVPVTSDYATNVTYGLASQGLTPTSGSPPSCFQGTASLDATATLAAGHNVYLCPAGQVIPQALFDPNAVLYLTTGYPLTSVLPAPNVPGKDQNIASVSLPLKDRDDIVRIDHNFNDKWAILGHYIADIQNQDEGAPELGWCWCSYNTLTSILTSPAHSAAIKLTGSVSNNLLVEASINYDGNGADISPSANTFLPSTWSVLPVVTPFTVQRRIWPGISGFGNPYGTAEDTATEPYHNAAQDYEPKVDISYTTGKHNFKFGYSYMRYTKNQMLYGDAQGDYGMGQLSNDGIMDMLLGIPGSYSQAQSAPIRHYVNQTNSAYAMDNWHFTSRLTLQLGLRYDALPHGWERNNLVGDFQQQLYNFNPADAPIWDTSGAIDPLSPLLYTQYPTPANPIPAYINGTGLAGQNHFPRGAVENDYRTLQPRVGFSDDMFGNGKTILRGGFGIFYERMQGNDIFDEATSPPFDPALSLGDPYFSTPGKNWNTGVSILPTALIFAGGADSLPQVYRAPATAQFSLGIQREIKPSLIWIVQYVGNLAWHQDAGSYINNMPTTVSLVRIGTGVTPGTCNHAFLPWCADARQVAGDSGGQYTGDAVTSFANAGGMNPYRTYPGYTSIEQNENQTNQNYNGFQTALRVQNRWGLSGELDYTYSHEIDVISVDNGGGNEISNPWYFKYDKASGQYDRRHMISANYVYKLPIATKSTGLVKTLAGGWSLAGTVIDESGVPSAPGMTINYDPIGLGGNYANRPNYTGGKMTYPKTVGEWFNTSGTVWSFPTPSWVGGPNLGFGQSGRDQIVGPGRVNFTTSLYKSFAIVGSAHFDLRFESFNTFNHTQFNSVNTSYQGSQFGQLTGTNDPRNLELGGRFVF